MPVYGALKSYESQNRLTQIRNYFEEIGGGLQAHNTRGAITDHLASLVGLDRRLLVNWLRKAVSEGHFVKVGSAVTTRALYLPSVADWHKLPHVEDVNAGRVRKVTKTFDEVPADVDLIADDDEPTVAEPIEYDGSGQFRVEYDEVTEVVAPAADGLDYGELAFALLDKVLTRATEDHELKVRYFALVDEFELLKKNYDVAVKQLAAVRDTRRDDNGRRIGERLSPAAQEALTQLAADLNRKAKGLV